MSCQAAQHTPSPPIPGAGAGFATGRGIRLPVYPCPEEAPLPEGAPLCFRSKHAPSAMLGDIRGEGRPADAAREPDGSFVWIYIYIYIYIYLILYL